MNSLKSSIIFNLDDRTFINMLKNISTAIFTAKSNIEMPKYQHLEYLFYCILCSLKIV